MTLPPSWGNGFTWSSYLAECERDPAGEALTRLEHYRAGDVTMSACHIMVRPTDGMNWETAA